MPRTVEQLGQIAKFTVENLDALTVRSQTRARVLDCMRVAIHRDHTAERRARIEYGRCMTATAERRIGVAEASALGRTLDAVLSEAGDDVRADISPLWSHDREAGQIVLLDADEKDL